MDFKILIIGTDINAYTMARCAHELYGKKVDLIGKSEMKFTSLSTITNITYEPNLWDTEVFKETLKNYAVKQEGKKILLIATNDFYVKLIVENAEYLKQWYVFNYPSLEITNSFLDKSSFYDAFHDVLDIPKTFVYSCKERKLPEEEFLYPLIIKPGDGVAYYKHKFEGQSKVYRIPNKERLTEVLKQIEDSGYEETLIIQEFIPGDDSRLFDCMFYVNSKGKAELATFAQIGLQEHTHTGVGNCTVLVNGYNEYGLDEALVNRLKDFLESQNYTGFAEFDLKYDERDQTYKVFEINPRQARCSYYFTASTKNLIACLVDDLIKGETHDFKISKQKQILSFVPKKVMLTYIKNENLNKEIRTLLKKQGYINSLKYKKDKSLKRKLYLFLRDINYIKKYRKVNWW
ncbi:MAG: carboxylate--amine ligase [Bacilli bacterium]|nr:carboxylate--amine ligase [Bacilli bacterium]